MGETVVEAYTVDDLLTYLKAKEDYIVIKGDYSKRVYGLISSHLGETELMGFELGSHGSVHILVALIDAVRDFIKPENDIDKVTKTIEKKLKLYKTHFYSNDEIVLKLKQLDY